MNRDKVRAKRRLRQSLDAAWTRFQPTLEVLEDRLLLSATVTVNTLADTVNPNDGVTSLREAIAASSPGDTIDFSVTGTITLAMGSLSVKDLTIDGPGAANLIVKAPSGQGTSVFITSGTTTLSGMTITGGNAVLGGGILNEDTSSLTVIDSVITGNVARRGGGIYVAGYIGGYGSVTVLNSTISHNQAIDPVYGLFDRHHYGRGGGIDAMYATVTIDKSTISANSALNSGGGIYAGNLQMTNSTVSGNSIGDPVFKQKVEYGAGLYAFSGTIVNSTISGNVGDGIHAGGVVVADSTITNNSYGVTSNGSTTLVNSIVAGNVGGNYAGPDFVNSINVSASRNNLIGDAGASGLVNGVNGNIVGVIDPALGPLADNGGPTETCAPFSFSRAVNAGDNSLVPIDPSTGLPYATDQTGAPRISGGGAVDIGAVELQGTLVPSTIVNTTTDDVAMNNLTSLREAIGFASRLGGTVTFDPTVFATQQTITLGHGSIILDGTSIPVTITGPGANLATVDADGAPSDFITRGTVTLSGLTLTGAVATGAIDNEEGALTVQDSLIANNQTSGIRSEGTLTGAAGTGSIGGTLTVVNSIIAGNQGDREGGGISSYYGVLAISNSVIDGNSAVYGGGIRCNGTVTISDSTISNNSAGLEGGGIFIDLHNDSATTTITNSIISGNMASEAGGGIRLRAGALTVVNSTVSGNSAIAGGGIVGDGTTVLDSTISGNSAIAGDGGGGRGGGILGGNEMIRNSTIVNNTASGYGGGGLYGNGSTVFNSIIAGNSGQETDVGGGSLNAASAYNLIGDAASAGGLVNGVNGNIVGVDPALVFGPLLENDGPTPTDALLPNSPAINAGDPNFDPNAFTPPLSNDQRGAGFARVSGGRVDIGAFEVQEVAPTITAPASVSVNPGVAFEFTSGNAISVSDPTGPSNTPEQLTLTASQGTISFGTTTGLTITGNGTSSVTASGTLSILTADLASLSYTANAGAASDTLSIIDEDTSDNISSATQSVSITVNQPPSITAPSSVTVNPGVALDFTSGNAISVSDPSGTSSTPEQLNLTASQGTISFGTTIGLTITGNGTSSVTASGALSDLTADLASLSYTTNAGATSDTLSIIDKDTSDNLSSATQSVSITVNQPPTIAAPLSVTVNPGAAFDFTNGNAIGLSDASGSAEQLTLTASHGTISFGTTTGLTITGNGTGSVTASGTLSNLTADLASLSYTANAGATSDTLTLFDKDTSDALTSATKSVSITVNQAPNITITAPAAASVNENSSLVYSSANGTSISIADTKAGSNAEQLTLTETHGTLTLASTKGVTFVSGSNNSSSMTIKGTLANLNAAIKGLTFKPTTGYSGAASLTIAYKDLGNNQTASATVAVMVIVPASQSTVTIDTLFTTGVPGEPIPLIFLVKDTNSAAQSAAFNFSVAFGDGATQNITGKSPLLINHVYKQPGTYTVTVTATDQYGHESAAATTKITIVAVFLGKSPFNSRQSALLVGGTTGNDTISLSASGKNPVDVIVDGVNEGVYSTNGPVIIFGQGAKDTVKEGSGLKINVALLESPSADNLESDLDNEALQWAGLNAAMEVLNA